MRWPGLRVVAYPAFVIGPTPEHELGIVVGPRIVPLSK